jgi:hypothetical protein
MKTVGKCVCVGLGIAAGVLGTMFYLGQPRALIAASNDRYQDNIMATGAVSINARIQTDGVWLLDYRAGKLLGTVIDRTAGKIVGWAEVDLRTEFNLAAQQDVHFMMTTGYVTQGQSALYLAETATGQFGVYTMGPGLNGNGVIIRRHDMTRFRQQANVNPIVMPAPGPVIPLDPPAGALPGLPPPQAAPVAAPPAAGAGALPGLPAVPPPAGVVAPLPGLPAVPPPALGSPPGKP